MTIKERLFVVTLTILSPGMIPALSAELPGLTSIMYIGKSLESISP